jgi:hypothetical protein
MKEKQATGNRPSGFARLLSVAATPFYTRLVEKNIVPPNQTDNTGV